MYQRTIGDRLPAATTVAVVLFALFGIGCLHDVFALYRARVEAADEMLSAGVPWRAISAGFEYDAWTELEMKGHINEPRIRRPAGSFDPTSRSLPPPCVHWISDLTPALDPQYGLSFGQMPCFAESSFQHVEFRTWLPPRLVTIDIVRPMYPIGPRSSFRLIGIPSGSH